MDEADANVLKVLRKSTMSSLSDAVYSEIEKAVDKDGIRNLKGTARDAVAFAVRKYNMNHDSSNGQFASSGAGGGSSTGANGDKNALASVANTADGIAKTYVENVKANQGKRATGEMLDMGQAYEDGLGHIEDIKSHIGSGNYEGARDSLNYAAKALDQSPVFAGHSKDLRAMADYFGTKAGGAQDFSNEKMIANAATMYGTGSKQHLKAVQRFTGKK